MEEKCNTVEKQKVLTEKLNALYEELTEYKSMVANLHDFKNKLTGCKPECESKEEMANEPICFTDKLQTLLDGHRRVNSDFSSILNELSEIL